ncbi:MAG: hypothetical protein JO372_02750 [Solirubrobacterales bacterium]|nr:hypothetical protein [Solirubrobacterales bacterium]
MIAKPIAWPELGPWLELSLILLSLWLGRYAARLSAGVGETPEALVFGDPALFSLALLWALLFTAGIYWPALAASPSPARSGESPAIDQATTAPLRTRSGAADNSRRRYRRRFTVAPSGSASGAAAVTILVLVGDLVGEPTKYLTPDDRDVLAILRSQ